MPFELRTWHCKACNVFTEGVICPECKRMYVPADPECELKD